MVARPARSLTVDWLMSLGGSWIITGIYCDLGWHVRNDVDSFLTWAHGVLYAGLFYSFIVVAIVSLRNVKAYGIPWLRAMPVGYEFALPGVLLFFLGGAAAAIGHKLWGFESGFDALLSPTHQLIGISIMLLLAGPIRSVRRASTAQATLLAQIPAVLCVGAFSALVHWGLNPLLNASPERIYAPYEPSYLTPDAITLHAISFYLQGAGLAVTVLQTVLTAAVILYLVRALDIRPGGITLTLLVANGLIGIALAETWLQGIAVIVATLVAGIVGDSILRNFQRAETLEPIPRRVTLLLCALVPFTFQAVFLLYTALFLGGIWWDTLFIFGTLLYSAILGFLLALVSITQRQGTRS